MKHMYHFRETVQESEAIVPFWVKSFEKRMLRKRFVVCVLLLLMSNAFLSYSSFGQVAINYLFTQTQNTYSEIQGGTVLWSGSFNNTQPVEVAIPAFSFDGNVYQSVFVSENGFITFGSAPASNNYTPLSSTATYIGAISGFGANLANGQTGAPEVSYKTVGNEFVFQWKDVRRYLVAGEIISFQIRLNTLNNSISIVYGGNIASGSNSVFPQVGLRGPNNNFAANNVNNRTIAAEGGNWINSLTGTANNNTMYFRSTYATTIPSSGLTFKWTPGVVIQCVTPAGLVSSNIGANHATVSWNESTTVPGQGYDWELRLSGNAGSGAVGLAESGNVAAGVLSKTFENLSSGTTYSFYIRSHCTEEVSSPWSQALSFSTNCVPVSNFPFSYGFDMESFPPNCWQSAQVSGAGLWQGTTLGAHPAIPPFMGNRMAFFNCYNYSTGTTAVLISPVLLFEPGQKYMVRFWMYRDNGYETNRDKLIVRANNVASYAGSVELGTIYRYSGAIPQVSANGWYEYAFVIPEMTGDQMFVLFQAVSDYGNNIFIDEVTVDEAPADCQQPASSASGLVLNPATYGINGTFNPAVGATGHLVVMGTSATLNKVPEIYKHYNVGEAFGNGHVIGVGPQTDFASPVLNPSTNYYFFVFPYADGTQCSGPVYRSANPLTGNIATSPEAPVSLEALALSPNQMDLNITSNGSGNSVMVAWNTVDQFGTPAGTYNAGSSILGGGTVHYVGNAQGLYNHSDLSHGKRYFYRAWSVVNGPRYSSTFTNAEALTHSIVPYLQTFDATTQLPDGWTGQGTVFLVGAQHGFNASNGLYCNLRSSRPEVNVSSPVIQLPAAPTRLIFDYRIVNLASYPNNPTVLGLFDRVDVELSTDGGVTYSNIYTINQQNHIASSAFKKVTVDLGQTARNIKIRIYAFWGSGNYYVDVDNFRVEVTPLLPEMELTPAEKDFGTVLVQTQSTAQEFILRNSGIGQIHIQSILIEGPNADQFILNDQNSYPLVVTEENAYAFDVLFSPTFHGEATAQVKIIYSIAGQPQIYTGTLKGNGFDATVDQFPFFESFEEEQFPALGWLNTKTAGSGVGGIWDRVASGSNPVLSPPLGTKMIRFNSFLFSAGTKGELVSPLINPSPEGLLLNFWMYRDETIYFQTEPDRLNVYWNTVNTATSGTPLLLTTINRSISLSPVVTTGGWKRYSIPLPAEAFQTPGFLIFEGYSEQGNSLYIDGISIALPFEIEYVSDDLSCFGSSDGSIEFDITGGLPPYSIYISGPGSYQSNQSVLYGLAAGDYIYSITDSEMISSSGLITLNQPSPIPVPTVENQSLIYDGLLHSIGAVAPPETELIWYDSQAGGNITQAPSASDAGVYKAWVVAVDELQGCESVRVEATLNIDKKQLNVIADDKTKCQYTPNPEFTFGYQGFVADEGPDNLNSLPVATTTATQNSDPGSYPIILEGGLSTNYVFNYTGSTLTIFKSPFVDAGPDAAICLSENFPIAEAMASNFNSILWSSSGDGSFSNANELNPLYTPGISDMENGFVVLTLTGDPGSSCSQQSDMMLSIQSNLDVEIYVVQLTEEVCPGTAAHFIAIHENGGQSPVFQWKVNGENTGSNSSDFVYVPNENDVVTVQLTSSLGCAQNNPAISDPFIVQVSGEVVPQVQITADATVVCDNTAVTFIAVPLNGGSNPLYQWFVNNEPQEVNNAVFTYIPENGDVVNVTLTSSHACAINPFAISNFIELESGPPYLELKANPVIGGTVSGTGYYPAGAMVEIVASPEPGWLFTHWSNADGAIVSVNETYSHEVQYCYEALTANFASTSRIAGQLKFFNVNETLVPSPNEYGVFYVQLYDGENPIGDRQLVRFNSENNLDSYFEFIGVESGKQYKLRVWEQATNNILGNVWSWNNWGGTTANDALIIGLMNANNPIITQLPWIAPVSVPNYTDYFKKVADLNNSNSLTAVDALILQYAITGEPGYLPLPGGANNFCLATTKLERHNAFAFPNAPELIFTTHGNYNQANLASEVYYDVMLSNLGYGLNVFNIYFVATGDMNASYQSGNNYKSTSNLRYASLLTASKGDELLIPFRVEQEVNLAAMSLELRFDPGKIEVLEAEGYPLQFIDSTKGTLRLNWVDVNGKNLSAGEVLVSIKIRIVGDLLAGERYFELSDNVELSDVSAKVLKDVELSCPYLTNAEEIAADQLSSLTLTIAPNPFRENSRVNYILPEDGQVEIVIYNLLGHEVMKLVSEYQKAGHYSRLLSQSQLRGAGSYVYLIRLHNNHRTYTSRGSLVIVE